MVTSHFGSQASLVLAERLGLCMEAEGMRWGADQQAFAQHFEPEKLGIAKVVVECRLEWGVESDVAGKG
jgi:hypothetical protein